MSNGGYTEIVKRVPWGDDETITDCDNRDVQYFDRN